MNSRKPLAYISVATMTLLLIGLAACTRSASPTQESSPPPVSDITNTSAPTAGQDPTETAEPTQTAYIPPTSPSAPTYTPSSQPPSGEPTPTPDLSVYNRQASISQSPEGRYQVRVVVSFPETPEGDLFGDQYHSLVEVTDLEGGQTITLVDQWSYYGLGLTTPRVLGWKAGGDALYLAERGVPDGCGPPFVNNLRQVDPQSGEQTSLEVSIRGPWAFSPGGDTLGYIQESEFVTFDLDSHTETRISFTPPDVEWWPANLAWSPAGDMALLSISAHPCGPPENRRVWFIKIDIPTGSTEILMREDDRLFTLLNWPLEGYAQLSDPEGTTWWIDTLRGDVAQAPPSQVAQAQLALVSFFDALNLARYAEADRWFGGSYDVLLGYNPDIDPSDHAALWGAACEHNGFQCIKVNKGILEGQPSPDSFRFRVSFLNSDGDLFVRGPCCGADEIEMPPQWEFPIIVERSQSGDFLVVDLPVYVP